VHTFWVFFAWPDGGAWSNVIAMPVCGLIAGLFAFLFRDHIGRAVRGWWHRHLGHRAELDEIRERLDTHADALDLSTPGGLAAVMDEVRRAVTAAESAREDIRALGVIARNAKPPPRRGATEMRKTGSGKAEDPGPAPSPAKPEGMGSRIAPKTRRDKP
jgi:hypothetical protein